MMSKRTKQCKRRAALFGILHVLCLFGPLVYYALFGYITGETASKVVMSFSVIVSIILAFLSLITSVTARAGLHRCILWVMIAGILFALKEVQTFIWIMCIVSILDELIFVKVMDHYKAALISNKEIDRRM